MAAKFCQIIVSSQIQNIHINKFIYFKIFDNLPLLLDSDAFPASENNNVANRYIRLMCCDLS